MAHKKPTGYVLHQDTERVVIVTGTANASNNAKTGGMLQAWILATAQDPIATIKQGRDAAICGDCKHAGAFGKRTCYVRIDTAPLTVYRCWKRGGYPYLPLARYADVFFGRSVRFGAYGDPAYIPVSILRWIAFFAKGHTGYTHQWKNRQDLAGLLMASVDSFSEWQQAKASGWRTFRVRAAWQAFQSREIACPASEEQGHKTTCAKCGLCNGQRFDGRADIAIIAHGIGARNLRTELIQIAA